jgi:hypothetical protein
LESASTWWESGPVEPPVDFEQEYDRHSFGGARNYISGLEELWLAIQNKTNRKEFERWIFEALYSSIGAQAEHFWGESHPGAWELPDSASITPERLRKAGEEYLAKRKDDRFQEKIKQLRLSLADRFEQSR